jgi:hypothetical protein
MDVFLYFIFIPRGSLPLIPRTGTKSHDLNADNTILGIYRCKENDYCIDPISSAQHILGNVCWLIKEVKGILNQVGAMPSSPTSHG